MPNTLSCCLTFDFDATSVWIGTAKSNDPCMISRGEFGAVAISRILKLLEQYDIRSSFCVPGHTAYAYPNLIKKIQDQGHEIVHHGWVHENPADFDKEGERNNLEKGLEALQEITGITPIGYRSPAWSLTPNSFELLCEYNFTYDSSCMGNDFYPYYLRLGDRWPADDKYHFGTYCELIELPVYWGLDDFPHFENQYSPASSVLEIWKDEFDYALKNTQNGLFTLTLHPQVIGRGHRIGMLEKLIQHMLEQEVNFEPLCEYVMRWKKSNPLTEWQSSAAVLHETSPGSTDNQP